MGRSSVVVLSWLWTTTILLSLLSVHDVLGFTRPPTVVSKQFTTTRLSSTVFKGDEIEVECSIRNERDDGIWGTVRTKLRILQNRFPTYCDAFGVAFPRRTHDTEKKDIHGHPRGNICFQTSSRADDGDTPTSYARMIQDNGGLAVCVHEPPEGIADGVSLPVTLPVLLVENSWFWHTFVETFRVAQVQVLNYRESRRQYYEQFGPAEKVEVERLDGMGYPEETREETWDLCGTLQQTVPYVPYHLTIAPTMASPSDRTFNENVTGKICVASKQWNIDSALYERDLGQFIALASKSGASGVVIVISGQDNDPIVPKATTMAFDIPVFESTNQNLWKGEHRIRFRPTDAIQRAKAKTKDEENYRSTMHFLSLFSDMKGKRSSSSTSSSSSSSSTTTTSNNNDRLPTKTPTSGASPPSKMPQQRTTPVTADNPSSASTDSSMVSSDNNSMSSPPPPAKPVTFREWAYSNGVGRDIVTRLEGQGVSTLEDVASLFVETMPPLPPLQESQDDDKEDGHLLSFQSFRLEGVGGLADQLDELFTRAFASRMIPNNVVEELGLQHVRGVVLYGPPGTGKTLIAREMGKILNAKEVTVVSGPEILSKYFGESEQRVRELFQPAEEDQEKHGAKSRLHVIVLDEMDAICSQRSGSDGETSGKLMDSVVNQILAKMDGVEQLNNILMIGLTNRLDKLDDALKRPGRFEVQIKIGLPDERGRREILDIHTKSMQQYDRLGSCVDLDHIAGRTSGFSGADLAGLVRSAASLAIRRCLEIDDDNDESNNDMDATRIDPAELQVLECDFHGALETAGITPLPDSGDEGQQQKAQDNMFNQEPPEPTNTGFDDNDKSMNEVPAYPQHHTSGYRNLKDEGFQSKDETASRQQTTPTTNYEQQQAASNSGSEEQEAPMDPYVAARQRLENMANQNNYNGFRP